MGKYDKETKVESSKSPAERLRDLERWEREKLGDSSWTLAPEIMNMMIEMVGNKHCPVKIFNWMKNIKSIRRQPNGIVLDLNNIQSAEKFFEIVPDALMGFFKTRSIATVFEGKVIKYLTATNVKEPLSAKGKELLARAKAATGYDLTDEEREKMGLPRWVYKNYPEAIKDGSVNDFFGYFLNADEGKKRFAYEWLKSARGLLIYPKEIAEQFARQAGLKTG